MSKLSGPKTESNNAQENRNKTETGDFYRPARHGLENQFSYLFHIYFLLIYLCSFEGMHYQNYPLVFLLNQHCGWQKILFSYKLWQHIILALIWFTAWRIARVYKVHAVLFWRELRLISGSVSVHWHSCQQIWRAPCGRSRDIRLHARTQKLTQPDAQKEKTNASLFPRRPSQPPAGSWRAEPCLSEPGAGWSDAFHPSSAVRCFPFRINWLTNGSQTCAPLQQRWPRGRRGK